MSEPTVVQLDVERAGKDRLELSYSGRLYPGKYVCVPLSAVQASLLEKANAVVNELQARLEAIGEGE